MRGADNMVFGRGYETKEQCEENLAALHDDMEVSRRNCVPLDVGGANWEIVKVVLPDGVIGPLPKEVFHAQNNHN